MNSHREPLASAGNAPEREEDYAPASVAGIDGGGTRTRLALATGTGHELFRRTASAGLIDPRDPARTAAKLTRIIRDAASDAGAPLPMDVVCAGLAGAGTMHVRTAVRDALLAEGIARRISILGDGEIAFEGALGSRRGILLVAGTGSGAYGRAQDDSIERCGGWGTRLGDEGSGYAVARDGLRAALHAADGRGPPTMLLRDLLGRVGAAGAPELAEWAETVTKGQVAALAPRVVALAANGDDVADRIIDSAAGDLRLHVDALLDRLAPWPEVVPVVFHGGLFRETMVARRVEDRLNGASIPVRRVEPLADAVAGAIRLAVISLSSKR